MKKTLSFITRIHRDLTLPLTAAAAFLLTQGCTPQKDVEDPQDNSIEKAAESLRSDPRIDEGGAVFRTHPLVVMMVKVSTSRPSGSPSMSVSLLHGSVRAPLP